MNYFIKSLISFFIFTIIGCFVFVKKIKAKRPVITIWIHGTHFVSNNTLKNVHSLVNKATVTFLNKEIPSFHAKDGLQPISSYEQDSYLLRKAKKLAIKSNNFPFEHFYTYGWSGKLSLRSREEYGIALYNELHSLLQSYRKKSRKPLIRIITHSHGGNVALQLAKAEKLFRNYLVVDELILLACPVQEATQSLIQEPIFKEIFSLYSPLDVVQVMDPQKLHSIKAPLFSERCFEPHDKIKQACITMNGKDLFPAHAMFLTNKVTNNLPDILAEMKQWKPGTISSINISA